MLQQFGGSLPKIDFQKLLFLLTTEKTNNFYDFVPYKYGCFSFQSYQDLNTMIKYEQISELNNNWSKIESKNFIEELTFADRISLVQFYNTYKNLRGDKLIKYIYNKYPYYAIKSEIAKKLLNNEELKNVQLAKPKNNIIALYTIGYEGKTPEYFANQLIKHDIKILCDVRKNPISMKYGFSKNQLKNIVENVGIEYIHIPELGIEAGKRKNLNSFEDYKVLFGNYKKTTIPNEKESLNFIEKLITTKKRVALTCFEADHNSCHRTEVAKAIMKIKTQEYDVIHL
ncbi:MAG: DUF488 family protein [bacterium]